MKATRYTAHSEARYGLYLSLRPLDMRFVGSTGESIDGVEGARYVRLPTWLLVFLGPALGAAFVLAFPVVIAVAMLLAGVHALARTKVAHDHAYVARGTFEPAASYFRGASDKPSAIDPELGDLADEVQARIASRDDAE